MQNYEIQSGTWAQFATEAKSIREQVFIQEQQIAPEDEWDPQDTVALHFVFYIAKQAIATARLLENHSIAGRGTKVTAWFRCGACSNATYYSGGKAAATSVG